MTEREALQKLASTVIEFNVLIRGAGMCSICHDAPKHTDWCPLNLFAEPMRVACELLKAAEVPALREPEQTDEEAAETWGVDQDMADARFAGLVHGSYYEALVSKGVPSMIAGNMAFMWAKGEM